MASYFGKFECAICQGTQPDASFCTLSCGHCFHQSCVKTWLERSPTCPGCRASASKRQIRVLNGVDAVLDAEGPSGGRHLEDQQQVINDLQQQLVGAEQQVASLEEAVRVLQDEHSHLQRKLKVYKHRCQETEEKRLQDAELLTSVNLELTKLRETHVTTCNTVERLRKDLASVRHKAAADLAHLRLQNPSLSLNDMRRLVTPHDQALQHLNWHELLAILAQRNEQLQQAESRATQLQEQLQQQQSETETQLAAACSQQQAAELRADKVQKESMKQVLVLEYANNKLQQENKGLSQQLEELQGVLLALQGTAVQQRTHQRQQHNHQGQHHVSLADDLSALPEAEQPSPCSPCVVRAGTLAAAATQPQKTEPQLASDLLADVTAAVGPGSMLQRPRHLASMPSFFKASSAVPTTANAGCSIQGQLLRHGPDGKGNTARHLGAASKRVSSAKELNPKPAIKRARGGGGGGATATSSIKSFFTRSNLSITTSTAS